MTKPKLTERLAQWAIKLQIKHETDKANCLTDFLSRRIYPTESADADMVIDVLALRNSYYKG